MSLERFVQKVATIVQDYNQTRTDLRDFLDHLLEGNVYDVVCDLGCGNGTTFGEMLRKHAKLLIGFELDPSLFQVASKTYDRVILADFQEIDKYLDSYDAIFMFDSLEHLPKEEGYNFLRRISLKAKLIVVVTPTKFAPSGPELFGSQLKGAAHQSLWTANEFLQLGFRCWIIEQAEHFWKNLYGDKLLAVWTTASQ